MQKAFFIIFWLSIRGLGSFPAEASGALFDQQLLFLSRIQECEVQKPALVSAKVDSADSDQTPYSNKKKKRFRKAVLQILICPTGDFSFRIDSFEIDLSPPLREFYFFHPDAGQEGRGPPVILA